jgi:hypothetical protein
MTAPAHAPDSQPLEQVTAVIEVPDPFAERDTLPGVIVRAQQKALAAACALAARAGAVDGRVESRVTAVTRSGSTLTVTAVATWAPAGT